MVARKPIQRLIPTIIAALFMWGCQAPDHVASPSSGLKADQQSVRPSEELFRRVAAEVPGFGGYYYDDAGDLVTYLTSDGSERQARASVGRIRSMLPPQHGQGRLVFKHGDYTFADLSDWRDKISEQLLGVDPNILSVDADEVHNRVTVGLSTPGTAALMREVNDLGIPERAIRVETTSPVKTQDTLVYSYQIQSPAPGGTLQSYYASAPGGAQIAFRKPSDPAGQEWLCTLGFPVKSAIIASSRGDSIFMVTASHCSSKTFEFDGQLYYQPDYDFWGFDPEYYFGNEVYDPHYFICCVAHYKTRYSDALMADIRGSGRTLMLARILKTTGYSTGRTSGTPGSITVNQSDPYFYIVSQQQSVPVGYTVDKMGRTTGWTRGQVNSTCVDRWQDDLGEKRLCNTLAYYWSGGGDSGGPVFLELGGNNVAAVGIHWGAFGSNGGRDGSATFSPLSGIERSDNLGALILP